MQLPIEAVARETRSSYGFRRLMALALDFFIVYSARPFRLVFLLGVLLAGLGALALPLSLIPGISYPGSPWIPWLTFFSGLQCATIGLLRGGSASTLRASRGTAVLPVS